MIVVDKLDKIFKTGKKEVWALDKVSIRVVKGSYSLIKGPSGCGKSSLLFTIGGLLKPDAGLVLIEGDDLYGIAESKNRNLRSRRIGFVFQTNYLIPYLTVFENIRIVNKVKGIQVTDEAILSMAEGLNLTHRLHHKPCELSVGEKQRVGLARAMIIQPDIILADEPTGNLDPVNTRQVLQYLHEFREKGGTVLMVTHGAEADEYADRIIYMEEGKVIS
ncbi:ABC transporter ATP-binding protein [Saccharicrinis sp. GN24d3]|uniref:ABC transporter ATP-binding protein n=1 Tax=Saccharicrinis sp. GN24d3 TaxID=3458416 RepID=UPI0040351D84